MKTFRSISAIVLAFLVLVSSTSFMVGVHFCGGHAQDVALFTKAAPCKMEQKAPPCHKQSKPCCEDETIVHKGEDFKPSVSQFHLAGPTSVDIEQPVVVISEIIPSSPVSQVSYFNYDPPLQSHDITVEHQVFLI